MRTLSFRDPAFVALTKGATASTLLNGLIHAWMLNEGTGSTVPDKVGTKDLTLQGGASWTTQSGRACINLTPSQWLDTAAWSIGANNVSISIWAYITSANNGQSGIFLDKDPVNTQFDMFKFGGGTVFLRGGGVTSVTTSNPADAWFLLTGTINGTAGKLYVNGADVGVGSTVDAFTDSSSALNVGRYNSGLYFTGKVSSIYIHDRAITSAEAAELYSTPYLF